MKPREVLGLDLGKARTGVARGNTAARLAEPMVTVPTKDLFEKLDEIMQENHISEVVVGLPRSLEGRDTAQTAWVRSWAKDAKARLKADIRLQDEALTTKQAEASKGNTDTDAQAAALILQDYLDSPEINNDAV